MRLHGKTRSYYSNYWGGIEGVHFFELTSLNDLRWLQQELVISLLLIDTRNDSKVKKRASQRYHNGPIGLIALINNSATVHIF